VLPITVPDGFRIIAHRGASAYAPENTAAAFRLAVEMGAEEIELDAQLSTDGVVVLCHDPTLERYGHGDKVVEEMSSRDLLGLDMGSWFSPHRYAGEKMATLEGLFGDFGDRLTYHVELKGKAKDLPDCVHNIIERHGLAARCVITSFCYDRLAEMRRLSPGIRLAWLVNEFDDDTLAKSRAIGLFQLCPRADAVTAAMAQTGRSAVSEIRAWGVSGAPRRVIGLIDDVVAAGCDGMTINWPDWVVHEKL